MLFLCEGKEGYQGIHSIGYIHKTVEISKSTWHATGNMGDQNTILRKLAAKELTEGAIPASNNGQRWAKNTRICSKSQTQNVFEEEKSNPDRLPLSSWHLHNDYPQKKDLRKLPVKLQQGWVQTTVVRKQLSSPLREDLADLAETWLKLLTMGNIISLLNM